MRRRLKNKITTDVLPHFPFQVLGYLAIILCNYAFHSWFSCFPLLGTGLTLPLYDDIY